MTEGDGDRNLCIFGAEVTPNHHKLAREFVLLDNFYCSGSVSADGHQWTDEAYATDYVEKWFAGWPRSYPHDGNDALAYARSGFLWDNALAHGKTLRVFGEFVEPTVHWKDPAKKGKPGFHDCYRDYVEKTHRIEISGTATIRTLEPYICPAVPGFQLAVTDQYRADQFLGELREYERRDAMPNLIILDLSSDHTSGTRPGMPAPEAAVADNDLALGRVVEGSSPASSGAIPASLSSRTIRRTDSTTWMGTAQLPWWSALTRGWASRGQHQLQSDEHGAFDRVDSGPAADEPDRRLSLAHGELFHCGGGCIALHGRQEHYPVGPAQSGDFSDQ